MTASEQLEQIADFEFRSTIPSVRFGTASDRYAGWIGQIYSESWREGISSRKKVLNGKSFQEQTLAVASVEEYFEHFSTLEIDYTFYRSLLNEDGTPTNNYFVLQRYADASPSDAQFILKAPQEITARVLRRGSGPRPTYVDNPSFLNSKGFLTAFVRPAEQILGSRFTGILFEQEYQRKSSGPGSEENIATFDGFFSALPRVPQIHIELRSPHLLTPAYFDWLETSGIGHVFSHWTWLPSLWEQYQLSGQRFTADNGDVVFRLLTPRKMPYANAYALAHPFDQVIPELSETPQAKAMIEESAALTVEALHKDYAPLIISNNRAWGNAPSLAQEVARKVIEELG